MKRLLILTLTLIISCNVVFSQTRDRQKNSIYHGIHEVRLGAIKLLGGPIFEGSYEYVIDENQGFGASLLVNFDQSNDWFENYALTPFYRFYFQTYQDFGAEGYFVEGFTSFFTSDYNFEEDIFDDNLDNNKDVFDIALGLAGGKKWINKIGFVFETKFGIGRTLIGNADSDIIIKGDVYIGYRF